MSDTDADLTALLADVRAKAEAVPSLYRTGWTYANCGRACCRWLYSDHLAEGHDPLNSPSALTHIARMDPATALRLVEAVERLSGEVAAAEADTARLTQERDDARAENERLRREYTPCDLDLLSRAEAAEAEVADLRTRLADAEAERSRHIDTLADEIAHVMVGSGWYANSIGMEAAREAIGELFDSTDPAVHDALTAALHANADRARVLAAHADAGWLDEETSPGILVLDGFEPGDGPGRRYVSKWGRTL